MSNKFLLDAQGGQLHGEVSTQNVTVSGSWPTALPVVPLAQRKEFTLYNGTGVDIWIGDNNVTQYTGIKIADGAEWSRKLGRATVYAITAGTTVSGVHVMEIA
jgi:hypothetical protein